MDSSENKKDDGEIQKTAKYGRRAISATQNAEDKDEEGPHGDFKYVPTILNKSRQKCYSTPPNKSRNDEEFLKINPDDSMMMVTGEKIKPTRRGKFILSSSAQINKNIENIIIPELPKGSLLQINILTTWGDPYYVGLNGIEIFSSFGEKVKINKVWADPKDINVLPEYSNDPRVVTNLLDSINCTRDDAHMWLTPFTPGKKHKVVFEFEKIEEVALIRIWNYNKSRIHSSRGARLIEMYLDKKAIFCGEITQASGSAKGHFQSFGDTILFTTDDKILEKISKNDPIYCINESVEYSDTDSETIIDGRPPTGDNIEEKRPFTQAGSKKQRKTLKSNKITTITLKLLSTWGHPNLAGLTGIEILGSSGENIVSCVTSFPMTKYIDNLTNNNNITCNIGNMWCVPLSLLKNGLTLKVDVFDRDYSILRVWNYNGNDDRNCGVKEMEILTENIGKSKKVLLRQGPGSCHYNYAQDISLTDSSSNLNFSQTFEDIPAGFVIELQLLSSWGDLFYIGLTGIEVYNHLGEKIQLDLENIAAYPESVNVLEGVDGDVRTVDKLIDDINVNDVHHSWLAPIIPHEINRLYIIFDRMTPISKIKIWNYGKTPTRGVREYGILIDGILMCNGELNCVDDLYEPQIKEQIISLTNYDADATDTNRTTRIIVNDVDNDSVDQSKRPLTTSGNNASNK